MAPRLRIPWLEAAAEAGQKTFTSRPRSLTADEQHLLLTIFGQSVNLDVVELAFTKLAVSGRAYTLANTIHIPEQMPKGVTFDTQTLVHEMTHVWQYQTQGTAYISDSIYHQVTQGKDAYSLTIVPGQALRDYGAEQQAMIVENYYLDFPTGFSKNPDVLRMIETIQRARPLTNTQIQQDRWFGPNNPAGPAFPEGDANQTRTVPLFRIEF
jgi:hypothetical protein